MPEVVEVRPKGLYVKIEYSLEELCLIKESLDYSQLNLDLSQDRGKLIKRFIENEYYPFITKITEDLSKQG